MTRRIPGANQKLCKEKEVLLTLCLRQSWQCRSVLLIAWIWIDSCCADELPSWTFITADGNSLEILLFWIIRARFGFFITISGLSTWCMVTWSSRCYERAMMFQHGKWYTMIHVCLTRVSIATQTGTVLLWIEAHKLDVSIIWLSQTHHFDVLNRMWPLWELLCSLAWKPTKASVRCVWQWK